MNPGTIADNVGDNVGDIAGMGADLFGSLAESTCACLVISGTSSDLINSNGYYYPLLISALGIVVSFFHNLLLYPRHQGQQQGKGHAFTQPSAFDLNSVHDSSALLLFSSIPPSKFHFNRRKHQSH
jgi:Na+/H+-translocating membrane pyrophosphatase